MLTEITIYCRGGQGGVTTARVVATAAMLKGLYAQAIPQFGPERRGATVNAYLRISDSPIRRRSSIKNPSGIVIFDRKINLNLKTKIGIINSSEPLKIAEKTYYLDATKIAEKYGLVSAGWAILSAPMSGAIAKAIGIELKYLEDAIYSELGERAEKSFDAVKEAYEV
ncbi:MAG: 2-oxoacid:acceptor oxidoreductase family protein, partial [Archaeoglobaceae archaeon]|nr:2-oxoacid:acceptor oxidoreductase family protein [Archaeoglobaceae archaeon]MDW8128849.1 2-oxoacid:acceptor oxidoreductase family protein [Archaeoglobaceae archaeon]